MEISDIPIAEPKQQTTIEPKSGRPYPGLVKRMRTAFLLIILACVLMISAEFGGILSWGIIGCTYLFLVLVALELISACSAPSSDIEDAVVMDAMVMDEGGMDEGLGLIGKCTIFLSLLLTPSVVLFLRADSAWFFQQHAQHFMLPYIILGSALSLFFSLFPVLFQSKVHIIIIEKKVLERLLAVLFVGVGGGTLMSLVSGEHVMRLFLWFTAVNAMNDSGAYFIGARFSSPSLSPVLSPKKTVLGSLGGLFCGIGTGLLLSFLLTGTLSHHTEPSLLLLLLGTSAIVVLAQLGDLMKSIIKRAHGMKDMGTTLPGHGGMLDRLDGMLVSCPIFAAFYLLLQALG
jgi:phosphatidate cytidylyltransferase